MFQTAIDVSKTVGHVFLVSAIGGFVGLCAAAWFGVTFVTVYIKYTSSDNNPACGVSGGGCSQGKLIGLLVFTVFSFYWLSEVIKNVMHVSVSGVYGSWLDFHRYIGACVDRCSQVLLLTRAYASTPHSRRLQKGNDLLLRIYLLWLSDRVDHPAAQTSHLHCRTERGNGWKYSCMCFVGYRKLRPEFGALAN
jgi:hypothetical protein